MNGYCWEKIDVGHSWGIKSGQKGMWFCNKMVIV